MLIGRNRAYEFAVGTLEQGPCQEGEQKPGRWIGYAIGYTPGGTPTMFLFPEICEGGLAGVSDRIRAIQMAAAIAQTNGWCNRTSGEIEWEIGPDLRAKPSDFQCKHCGEMFCRGACQDPDGFEEDGFWEE